MTNICNTDVLETTPSEPAEEVNSVERIRITKKVPDELLECLLKHYKAHPEQNPPSIKGIISNFEKFGYVGSVYYAKQARKAFKECAPELFPDERCRLSHEAFKHILDLLVAHYKAHSDIKSPRYLDIEKVCIRHGHKLSIYYLKAVRTALKKRLPELFAPEGLPIKKASEKKLMLNLYATPADVELYKVFADATGCKYRGQAFSLLMRVLAHVVLSHQLNLTHSIRQARTLPDEDVQTLARYFRGIDWSVRPPFSKFD
ncbi:hypothetical protein ACFQUU_25200 [Herbaspirillum sp. GCM10030257]|uniref:hypothetical protein n=1 Tax=Herbaspirillum sp. GCM10030257 TaxID=3273393 RepID=UPI00360F2BA0